MYGGKFMKSITYLSQTWKSVINQRWRNMAEGIACRLDILQLVIETGDYDKLGDSEIIAQAMIFLIRWYETTANTLALQLIS